MFCCFSVLVWSSNTSIQTVRAFCINVITIWRISARQSVVVVVSLVLSAVTVSRRRRYHRCWNLRAGLEDKQCTRSNQISMGKGYLICRLQDKSANTGTGARLVFGVNGVRDDGLLRILKHCYSILYGRETVCWEQKRSHNSTQLMALWIDDSRRSPAKWGTAGVSFMRQQ